MSFQQGAFQADAFQQTVVPPAPQSESSGGGRYMRHFAGGETKYYVGPEPEKKPDAAQNNADGGLAADADRYARERVESLLNAVDAVDAAQQALEARSRLDEISRLIDLQIARDEEEAIILILAMA